MRVAFCQGNNFIDSSLQFTIFLNTSNSFFCVRTRVKSPLDFFGVLILDAVLVDLEKFREKHRKHANRLE